MSAARQEGHDNSVGRLRLRADGRWLFYPSSRYARAGVGNAVLGFDEAEARRRFEERCADIARTVTVTPVVRHDQAPRVPHPLDRDPNALVARPDPQGWTVLRGSTVIASGLPPFRALDMVRDAGGVVERALADA